MKWLIVTIAVAVIGLSVLFGVLFPDCRVPYWLSGIGALVVAFVAVFQEKLRELLFSPELDVEVSMEPPDWSLMPEIDKHTFATVSEAWYSRILVKNEGNDPARNVFVRVKSISKQLTDGTSERVSTFLPMNLRWANTETVYFERIYRDVPVHCGFGKILDPARRCFPFQYNPHDSRTMAFSLSLEAFPSNLSHLLWPGTYRVSVVAAAENAKPKECTFQIFLSEKEWTKDQEKMKERVRIWKIS